MLRIARLRLINNMEVYRWTSGSQGMRITKRLVIGPHRIRIEIAIRLNVIDHSSAGIHNRNIQITPVAAVVPLIQRFKILKTTCIHSVPGAADLILAGIAV